jgi:hypothetical protein
LHSPKKAAADFFRITRRDDAAGSFALEKDLCGQYAEAAWTRSVQVAATQEGED